MDRFVVERFAVDRFAVDRFAVDRFAVDRFAVERVFDAARLVPLDVEARFVEAFFLLAELMTDAAVKLGLEHTAAQDLALQTLYGSGLMARQSDGDLARLRAEVTSKGGTTEAALRSFEAANLRGIVNAALGAATDRGVAGQ